MCYWPSLYLSPALLYAAKPDAAKLNAAKPGHTNLINKEH